MKHRKTAIFVIAGLAVVGLGACSQDYKGLGDAGVGKRQEAPRDVIVMPDQFANVAMACDGHGHRVYVTTRPNSGPVIVTDPSCPVLP